MNELALRAAQRADLKVRSADGLVERLANKYSDRITGYFKLAQTPPRSGGISGMRSRQRRAKRWRVAISRSCIRISVTPGMRLREGEHVVVVTPTASGKSLCYHLPVIEAVRAAKAKALYLFPTKALAQDQVAELLELNRAGDLGVRAFTFDGDTPADARQAIRLHGDIVVSNPDMLHQAILPHHTKWAQFFENLRYVVIDELHTYRGVFGSHVANVLRRLKRICAFYGVSPQFICCSATIGNPKEHAEAADRCGRDAITESGAPRGERHVLLWNPPVINPDLGIRASARSQTNRIARHAIRAKLKTIVFAQSRLMVEVLTKYLKDVFDSDPRKPERIRAYRGGYLPTERRADRTRAARGIDRWRRHDVGARTRRRHRRARRRRPQRLSGLDRSDMAAPWPRRAAGSGHRSASSSRRARRSTNTSIRHPEFFENAPPEMRAHRARPAADSARSHPLRRVRTAVRERRTFGTHARRGVPRSARRVRRRCIAKAIAGTGSPTAIRRRR